MVRKPLGGAVYSGGESCRTSSNDRHAVQVMRRRANTADEHTGTGWLIQGLLPASDGAPAYAGIVYSDRVRHRGDRLENHGGLPPHVTRAGIAVGRDSSTLPLAPGFKESELLSIPGQLNYRGSRNCPPRITVSLSLKGEGDYFKKRRLLRETL
jgi:hypothetical protein